MTDNSNHRNSQPYEPVGELVSIFKRGNTWWANWQHAGRQHRKSLNTKSKKEARLRALRLEADVLSGEYRKKVKAASITDVVSTYVRHLETERRKPKTLVKYRGIFDRLCQIAEENHIQSVEQITVSFMDKYRHARVQAGVSAKTVYNETVVVRQVVNFAKSRGMLPGDPLKGLRISEPKPTPQPCFTREEVELILESSHEPQRWIFTSLPTQGHGSAKSNGWHGTTWTSNAMFCTSARRMTGLPRPEISARFQ